MKNRAQNWSLKLLLALELFSASHTARADETLPQPPVSAADKSPDAFITQALKAGMLTKVDAKTLSPDALKPYQELAQKHGIKTLPDIYTYKDGDGPIYNPELVEGSKPVILASERLLWTPQYVAENIIPTDQQIADNLALVWQKPQDMMQQYPFLKDLLAQYQRKAAQMMPGKPVPAVYVDIASGAFNSVYEPLYSGATKEGHSFVVLTAVALDTLTPAQILACMEHETGHIVNDDVTVKSQVRIHNEHAEKSMEMKADAKVMDVQDFIGALENVEARDKANYYKQNPGKTDADYAASQAKLDPNHPSVQERIQALHTLQHGKGSARGPAR